MIGLIRLVLAGAIWLMLFGARAMFMHDVLALCAVGVLVWLVVASIRASRRRAPASPEDKRRYDAHLAAFRSEQ